MIWFSLAFIVSEMGPPYKSLANILNSGIVLIAILTIGLVIFKGRFEKAESKLSNTVSVLIISIPVILITVITSLVDSSDELLKTITAYSPLSIAGLATAGGLIGLLFLVFLLVVGFRRHGNIEDPYLFNEMQFTLGGIL